MQKEQKKKWPLSKAEDVARCRLGACPKNDNGYFEKMTKTVFCSGMKWDVVDKKWPGFRKAFANFSVQKVSRFDEPDIDRLMQDSGIIRNYRKVTATVQNAREFLIVRKEHGSFINYLKTTGRDGEEALCRALVKRFSFLGGSTALFFLRAVGEEMPETMRMRKA